MRELDSVAGIAVSVEDDPPPIVRALANDLGAALADTSFAEATHAATGVVAVRSALTPQAATVKLGGGRVELVHGVDGNADVTATTDSSEDGGAAIEGPAELAGWAARLLDPPLPSLPEAAERFWSVLSSRPGAPDALLVVEPRDGEQHRFGADEGRTCELHGDGDGLLTVLTGRASAIEAAFIGAIRIRGTFPDISVLSGAGYEIRYGNGALDG